jgi:two-component system, LytTR family, sensor kinase
VAAAVGCRNCDHHVLAPLITFSTRPEPSSGMLVLMRRYWAFQWTGWLAYSAAGMAINLLAGVRLGPLLVGHVALVSGGIGLTHLLRRAIHQRRSPHEPISRLWPLLAFGSVAISVMLTGLVIGVNRLLDRGSWDLTATVALWWGMLLATGVWSLLYVRFSERRQQEVREEELQRTLREAHLLALEAQINPHFLFNALNSIRALVEIDPPRAQDMLTRLSNVLRNGLRRLSEHTVTLGSELEAVSDYLALETIRFADRLHASVVANAGLAGYRVPPMVLQTLVENAVKHGVGQVSGRAELAVSATGDDQTLVIAVRNTGKLASTRPPGGGMGLQNTRERLKLLYGDRAALRLEQEGDRVLATVTIPLAP